MILSYRWLEEWVETGLSPQKLADALTRAGCAIDAIEPLPDGDVRLIAEVTTNRPDCLCHQGVAREIAAMTGRPLRLPTIQISESTTPVTALAHVRVEAPDLCPRYTARVIEGVKVAPSPPWLQRRLEAVGLRPINNIVDVTNLVLMEMNQPLHAFDRHRLAESTIVVRRARKGEEITAIDGTHCRLDESMLVIADAHRPVAIAGIMGGAETEVSESTVSVLLEAAYFEPTQIRRTSRALHLASESSYRFERGIDPGAVERASARAAQLMVELAGGQIAQGVIDTAPHLGSPWTLSLRYARCQSLLGIAIPPETIAACLAGLGLEILSKDATTITVRVPSFRQDLTREIDLIEEVIRLVGYERVPSSVTLPLRCAKEPREFADRRLIREMLVGLGYTECITDAFVPSEWLEAFPCEATPLCIMNPVNAKRPLMRTTLLPSLLDVMRVNRLEADVRLFEIARVYHGELPQKQPTYLALLDDRDPTWTRGAIEAIGEALDLEATFSFEPIDHPAMVEGSAARLLLGNRVVGISGLLSPAQVKVHDLLHPPAILEINLSIVGEFPRKRRRYTPLPRFPSVRRDIALVVPEEVLWQRIEELIRQTEGPIESIRYLSTFRGGGVEPGKKSVAFEILYRASDRSLTDEEANAFRDAAVRHLTSAIPGSHLR